ncbi:DUF3168 domain-containing protein [Bradyrhizobium sp. SZCCHNRI2007]|uniref:DUF3168 domain-containing protein n=1 Tax=Bradyrhizobium sp. SZCCHNRI2007 TaxID=3057281 RepID=UPI0028E66F75|nr:DUF3168 domain-containing protein [Bradyrhizobium sp. SZCCHNRI2007]
MTTMVDPTLAVQAAVVRVLRSAATAAGSRIFCPVPMGADFPYVSIGQIQVINERFEGLEGALIHLTLHAWSRSESRVEVRTLAAQIVAALDGSEGVLTGPDLQLNSCMFENALHLDDPDGKTAHAVLTFQLLTD